MIKINIFLVQTYIYDLSRYSLPAPRDFYIICRRNNFERTFVPDDSYFRKACYTLHLISTPLLFTLITLIFKGPGWFNELGRWI